MLVITMSALQAPATSAADPTVATSTVSDRETQARARLAQAKANGINSAYLSSSDQNAISTTLQTCEDYLNSADPDGTQKSDETLATNCNPVFTYESFKDDVEAITVSATSPKNLGTLVAAHYLEVWKRGSQDYSNEVADARSLIEQQDSIYSGASADLESYKVDFSSDPQAPIAVKYLGYWDALNKLLNPESLPNKDTIANEVSSARRHLKNYNAVYTAYTSAMDTTQGTGAHRTSAQNSAIASALVDIDPTQDQDDFNTKLTEVKSWISRIDQVMDSAAKAYSAYSTNPPSYDSTDIQNAYAALKKAMEDATTEQSSLDAVSTALTKATTLEANTKANTETHSKAVKELEALTNLPSQMIKAVKAKLDAVNKSQASSDYSSAIEQIISPVKTLNSGTFAQAAQAAATTGQQGAEVDALGSGYVDRYNQLAQKYSAYMAKDEGDNYTAYEANAKAYLNDRAYYDALISAAQSIKSKVTAGQYSTFSQQLLAVSSEQSLSAYKAALNVYVDQADTLATDWNPKINSANTAILAKATEQLAKYSQPELSAAVAKISATATTIDSSTSTTEIQDFLNEVANVSSLAAILDFLGARDNAGALTQGQKNALLSQLATLDFATTNTAVQDKSGALKSQATALNDVMKQVAAFKPAYTHHLLTADDSRAQAAAAALKAKDAVAGSESTELDPEVIKQKMQDYNRAFSIARYYGILQYRDDLTASQREQLDSKLQTAVSSLGPFSTGEEVQPVINHMTALDSKMSEAKRAINDVVLIDADYAKADPILLGQYSGLRITLQNLTKDSSSEMDPDAIGTTAVRYKALVSLIQDINSLNGTAFTTLPESSRASYIEQLKELWTSSPSTYYANSRAVLNQARADNVRLSPIAEVTKYDSVDNILGTLGDTEIEDAVKNTRKAMWDAANSGGTEEQIAELAKRYACAAELAISYSTLKELTHLPASAVSGFSSQLKKTVSSDPNDYAAILLKASELNTAISQAKTAVSTTTAIPASLATHASATQPLVDSYNSSLAELRKAISSSTNSTSVASITETLNALQGTSYAIAQCDKVIKSEYLGDAQKDYLIGLYYEKRASLAVTQQSKTDVPTTEFEGLELIQSSIRSRLASKDLLLKHYENVVNERIRSEFKDALTKLEAANGVSTDVEELGRLYSDYTKAADRLSYATVKGPADDSPSDPGLRSKPWFWLLLAIPVIGAIIAGIALAPGNMEF
ncbi:MAG: hypothetical protein Q3972_03940 [Corynebacterium sp.]|nr:hypothetical protein [Corynebacterium sp.]